MKKYVLITSLLLSFAIISQAQDPMLWELVKDKNTADLNVFYHINEPFVFEEKGELKGIEIDILNYFVDWVEEKKGIEINLKYNDPLSFSQLLSNVESAKVNSVGIGTVTISDSRKQSLNFSAPYLKNVSVLVSDGNVRTSRKEEQLSQIFTGMIPVSVKNSLHHQHLLDFLGQIKASSQNIEIVSKPMEVIKKIEEHPRYYGYLDIITFWKYVKENDRYLKMHKVANRTGEKFGFIFPKNSDWANLFNEFFESGFGFTATKDYHNILEKHLGYEVLNSVELN
jgi:putative glutamine transport system substrate-binding protein